MFPGLVRKAALASHGPALLLGGGEVARSLVCVWYSNGSPIFWKCLSILSLDPDPAIATHYYPTSLALW